MIFSDLTFLFRFFPLFFLCYLLCPKDKRNWIIVAGSLVFYSFGGPLYNVLLLALSGVFNHYGVLYMAKPETSAERKKQCFIALLAYNLGILLVFKYVGVLVKGAPGLPLGISFYTFQILSYVFDVYRGAVEPAESLLTTATYLTLFPRLAMGPIIRYPDQKSELLERPLRRLDRDRGLSLFLVGLGYKVLLADRLATMWTSLQTIGFENLPTWLAWMGAIGYSLQLYFDFHGYSLMAVGLGQMLGFHFPQNFNLPYLSRSVSEFWRRWHITLGAWFRDYVYIPLGGSRGDTKLTLRNLFIVWLLTGLWHGSGLNFILWGLVLFAFIAVEKLWLGAWLAEHPVISHVYLVVVMPLTWVIFACGSLGNVGLYFSRLFPFFGGVGVIPKGLLSRYLIRYLPFLIAGVFFCLPFFKTWFEAHRDRLPCRLLLFAVFWVCIYLIAIGGDNPFLYFSF